jgi:predicted alpha/beta superfamily hydrolase
MMKQTLVFVVVALLVCDVAHSATIQLTMVYPRENLPADPISVGLRGSAPLSWTSSITMSTTATNTWSTYVSIPSWNGTFPYDVDFKVTVAFAGDQLVWEAGANRRVSIMGNNDLLNKTIYPYFNAAPGTTSTISAVYSPQLDNKRDVFIYAPPGSTENYLTVFDKILIMQDGQNLQDLWGLPGHLDGLINGGQMESVFVVGPYNTPDRIAEYTYSVDPQNGGGKGDLYLDFVWDTLMPAVAKTAQLNLKSGEIGIMGSSLGGLISCYAGITRPHIYTTVGCMSSSFWWNNFDFLSTIVPKITTQNSNQRYYIDSGDSGYTDDGRTGTSAVASAMVQIKNPSFQLGTNFFWYLQRGGQHNEASWSARFDVPMQYLYFHDALYNRAP